MHSKLCSLLGSVFREASICENIEEVEKMMTQCDISMVDFHIEHLLTGNRTVNFFNNLKSKRLMFFRNLYIRNFTLNGSHSIFHSYMILLQAIREITEYCERLEKILHKKD